MRVLTTNSLILAAISLVPSVSAAPHTGSSVDSYSNLAALAQDPGPSSIPNVRRDEVISAESLYGSSFEGVFGPVADLFKTIGMNSISNDMPLTEEQEKVLGALHERLDDAVSHMSPHLPLSAPASRSLQENQLVDPPAPLNSLYVMGDRITRLLQVIATLNIQENPTTPLSDVQKNFIQKFGTAIDDVVQDVTSFVPKPDVMPLDHAHSVQKRSLQNLIPNIGSVPLIGSVLERITGLLRSSSIMDGGPLNDVQEQALLSKVKAEVIEAVQKVKEEFKEEVSTVHIEHTREEHEDCDHHDDHHSHDEHKRDSKPHGAHRNSHKSPDTQSEDRHTHGSDRGGDHCREPRDGYWDEREDCGHHNNGKDRNEDSSLLKISLGNSRHP